MLRTAGMTFLLVNPAFALDIQGPTPASPDTVTVPLSTFIDVFDFYTLSTTYLNDGGAGAVTRIHPQVTQPFLTLAQRITLQPSPNQLAPGSRLSLGAAASLEDPQFIWRKNGQVLPGQNQATLVIENVSANDAGWYGVTIHNPGAFTVSDQVLVSVGGDPAVPPVVTPPPVITPPPVVTPPVVTPPPEVTPPEAIYQPAVGSSWQWQLSGAINTAYDVDLYDIDLFDTPKSTIDALQARGIKVMCYFSAGSYENWRSDADRFPAVALGKNLDGWEGERWLDIRHSEVRRLMATRMDLAVAKGCDGVEPDNVDGYTNSPGFSLTAADQLDYNRFLAEQAHQRGLAIGLKNDLDQVASLVDLFDFAVNEQCHEYNECYLLKPFVDRKKAVLNAEYQSVYRTDSTRWTALCQDAVNAGISTLVMPLDLNDAFRQACP